jgi:uncharacterized glyoxalase superfamily protein PhnB
LKQRTGDPWMPAAPYGRELPTFTVNLLVRDVPRAASVYTKIFAATVHYADPDFAAINVGGVEMMLHADHTYDKHPWHAPLTRGERRGLGAELRVLGIDPDAVERRARDNGASLIQPATTKAHGWREVMVEDVDGYLWAVGLPTTPEK